MTQVLGEPEKPDLEQDLTAYADGVRRLLRQTSPTDFEIWRDAYERGITTAYRRHDIDGLLAIATFGAACLDAQGFHEQAVAQLTFAVEMASGDANAATYLLGVRAALESIMGWHAQAATTMTAAKQHLTDATEPRARIAFATYDAIVQCVSLELAERPRLTSPIPEADREGFDWFSSALRCWLVCYLFAIGDSRAATLWAESLRMQAEATDHPARRVDASVLLSGARALSFGAISDDEDEARRTLNYNALWRLAVLRLHRALQQGAWNDAERALAILAESRLVVSPGFSDGVAAFAAALGAQRGGADLVELEPPTQIGVMNIGAVLAGIEVVAVAGSQAAAASWLTWISAFMPVHIHTSLEWPACLDRVVGLLRIRAGDERGGIAALRRAIRWCDSAGYLVEGKVARLQLAEVLERSAAAGTRREIADLRDPIWTELAALGVDPTRHAYTATRAIALSQDVGQPRLTKRETEVLALLGEGMTYQAAALPLGISWRTVQSHAHRAYSKLGATGRMQAIALAREQQIL